MALFGRNKKTEPARTTDVVQPGGKKAAEAGEVSRSKVTPGGTALGHLSEILRAPRITEKASSSMGVGIYTFDVADRATKRDITKAIFEIYNVRPRMVRIVNIRGKVRRNARTGQYGMSRSGKKAYVYLKKGETIS